MRAVDCGFQSRKKSMGGLSTNPERILNGISEVYLARYFYLRRIFNRFPCIFMLMFPNLETIFVLDSATHFAHLVCLEKLPHFLLSM